MSTKLKSYDSSKRFKDITGQKFGRLTALHRLHNYHKKGTYWLCECECGNLKEINYRNLRNNNTKSCGCLCKEGTHHTHNKTNTKLYNVWCGMKSRCYYKNHNKYDRYGARGIVVCDEWKDDFETFYNWAMENNYKEGLTIDRIDNDGNYEPINCRWVTNKEQSNNRSTNVNIYYNGYNYNLAQWGNILNLSHAVLSHRYHNNYDTTEMLTKRTDDKHLYPHQVKILADLYEYKNCALYLDMGLGKTITGAIKAVSYHNPILIVCPKSVIPQWLDCFRDWCKDWTCYDLTKKKQLEQFISDNNIQRMGVINYESCWRRPELQKVKGVTLMLDESQAIANNTSKQTKGVFKIDHKNCILLSGTPASNARYDKLYTQLKLLGLQMNKRSYEDRYCNFFEMENAGIQFRVLSRSSPYKHVQELKDTIKNLGGRFMKTEEVLDLPDQRFINVFVNKSKDYKTFETEGYVDCGDVEYISNGPAQDMLFMRQLCNSKSKLEMLKTLVESTNDRIVIFYNFDIELKLLQQCISKLKRPMSFINGHEKNLNCYNNNDDSITLVQYQSGSAGINLQKANKMIYYSPPVKSDFYEQSKKRIHRIGQENKCTYWKLITRDSIELKIYKTLDLKRDYNDELFRRDYDTN